MKNGKDHSGLTVNGFKRNNDLVVELSEDRGNQDVDDSDREYRFSHDDLCFFLCGINEIVAGLDKLGNLFRKAGFKDE